MRPRLRSVAELAGVSEPTVSRVLNGRPGVAPATRQRVIDALAELGFTDVPDPGTAVRGVVGIVTGELTNPVFPVLIHEITSRLSRHGIAALIGVASMDLAPEERYVREFDGNGGDGQAVDGIVFIAGRHAEWQSDLGGYRALFDSGVPIVLVNGGDSGLDVPHVVCDEAAAADKAVRHLVALGHTRIGCVLGSRQYVATHRFVAGFTAAMAELDLAWTPDDVVEAPFTHEGGRAGGLRLLERGLTGLICGNDLMALGTLGAAASLGLRVPVDASVVGYDGTDLTLSTDPPLTTLRQPFSDMGELVADALVSEINQSFGFRDRYVFAPELVARGSTGPTVVHPAAAR